jgi:alpha-D-ribose 1-methylphosphonate 5-triphosphate synthase subunit PhnI
LEHNLNARELSEAITHLKPDSEYVFQEADYSTIEWKSLEGDAPTLAEIDATIELIKQKKIEDQAEAEAKRQSALAKLAAVGLEEDDLKALGL